MGLKRGIFLPIYSKDDVNNIDFEQINEQYCQDRADNEYNFLAIAKIVDIKKYRSTLEIILQQEDSKPVEVGDIIKSVLKSDNRNRDNTWRARGLRGRGRRHRGLALRERRNNKKEVLKTKQPLRLGLIYADIDLEVRGRLYRYNMTSLVRQYIMKEADEFDFQIFTGPYSNYNKNRYHNQNQYINSNQYNNR